MTKVMIVDDELDLREMTEIVMKNEGYETTTAVDGDDFLSRVETERPDVVTLDVMMPGPNTWEILSRLHEMNWRPQIILVTVVRYSPEEQQKLKEMGVVNYVTKPFDVDTLSNAVRLTLEQTTTVV